jgi:hypothetical protein
MDSSRRSNKSQQEEIISQKEIVISQNKGWFNECSTPTANEMIYLSQISVIFIVMIVSLYNLSFKTGDDSLWTALLTSCLGYMLPNPKMKNNRQIGSDDHSSP